MYRFLNDDKTITLINAFCMFCLVVVVVSSCGNPLGKKSVIAKEFTPGIELEKAVLLVNGTISFAPTYGALQDGASNAPQMLAVSGIVTDFNRRGAPFTPDAVSAELGESMAITPDELDSECQNLCAVKYIYLGILHLMEDG